MSWIHPEAGDISLTRIIQEAFAVAADPAMSAALRPVGFFDVLSSASAGSSCRATRIHADLRRLAADPHE